MLALILVAKADLALRLPVDLSPSRRELVSKAMEFHKQHPDVPYLEGGADSKGMDCSGAVVSLLKLVNIEPPRSAQGQYEWLKKSGRLTLVPAGELTADDPVFRSLQPGDLVFWAKETPGTADGFRVSHVHMYLGKEPDGHAVMIGSSDGRSYRGKKLSGFGIVDFRVPKPGSATRIVGFGSPLPTAAKTSTDPGKARSTLPQPNPNRTPPCSTTH
jgi:peptidoglycan DL-endopeptidase CwlO